MYFQTLVNRISPKLKGITHRLNGRFTFFNDEDLYQEAMSQLWVDYTGGKLFDKTDSYILQGCYFHLKNHIRKVQDKACLVSMQTLIGEEENSELESLLCLEDPRSCLEDTHNKILIEEIMNDGLTTREKEVFSLCLKGLTTREIGKLLGISHVMVVKLRSRIKDKCQKFKESV
ncbi:MAG: sigma-70 family RNA polymerase sigma factor [Candidatus Omnitrophica bacterium]|nr:sigma-70 family RNA polymerase sigma factor [Candidatus Omnitrophota bacterium]